MLFALIVCVLGCNQAEEKDSTLTQPPYDKLTDSIQLQPQNAGLYYRRGTLLYQNEQLQLAKQDLQEAWQLEPSEEHALSVVTVLIKTNPDSAIQFIQHQTQS